MLMSQKPDCTTAGTHCAAIMNPAEALLTQATATGAPKSLNFHQINASTESSRAKS